MATLLGFSRAIVVGNGPAGRCGPGVQIVPDPNPGPFDDFNRTIAQTYGGGEIIGSPSGATDPKPYFVDQNYDTSTEVDGSSLILHCDGDEVGGYPGNNTIANGRQNVFIFADVTDAEAYDIRIAGDYDIAVKFSIDYIPSGYDDGHVYGFTYDHSVGIRFDTEVTIDSMFSDWTEIFCLAQISSDPAYGGIWMNDRNGKLASTFVSGGLLLSKTDWLANEWYWMRMKRQLNPSTISFKVWRDTDGEPGTWLSAQPTTAGSFPIAVAAFDIDNYVAVQVFDDRRIWDTSGRPGGANAPVPYNVKIDQIVLS